MSGLWEKKRGEKKREALLPSEHSISCEKKNTASSTQGTTRKKKVHGKRKGKNTDVQGKREKKKQQWHERERRKEKESPCADGKM